MILTQADCNAVNRIAPGLLSAMFLGYRSAVAYIRPDFVAKVTAGSRADARTRGDTRLFTVGKPNYKERQFVKAALKAGEPFPIRKILLRRWPDKKAKKR